jgi:hypothetical protein
VRTDWVDKSNRDFVAAIERMWKEQEEYLDRVETLARSMYDAAHDRIWSGDHAFLLSTVTSASFWWEMASVALVAEEKWQRA